MIQPIHFVKTATLPMNSEKIISFGDDLEFTLKRHDVTHDITNIKGDFEITKITECYDDGQTNELKCDKSSVRFVASDRPGTRTLTFYIDVMAEMSEVAEAKEIFDATYEFQIPSIRLQWLEIYQFFKDEFVLPGYDDLKFTYYVRKIEKSTDNDIEIRIENPYDVKINGKKGDFKFHQNSTSCVDLPVVFWFYRAKSIPKNDNDSEGDIDFLESTTVEPNQALDESRPESVIPSHIPSNENFPSKLFIIGSNDSFADVYFLTSNGDKIASHRNILAAFSDIFEQIFKESSEIPVQINVENFDSETIQCALNFLYEKNDAINGKEIEVFKFAVKFGIQSLIDFCCSFFEESVSPSNVCEFIQIAYLHNFEKLKQKCLKLLVEKKTEIDPSKLAELPKNILFDAFCF